MKRQISGLILLVIITALASGQGKDPFRGITDEKVLPMLKHLPYRHGGMNVPASDGRLLYDIIKYGYIAVIRNDKAMLPGA